MWQSLQDLWHAAHPATIGVWALTATLMIAGLLGMVVPVLPGPFLILLGAILHKVLLSGTGVSWWSVVLIGLLCVAAYVVDFISGAMGTKWFGGSKWGIWGVLIGGVVGLFFMPVGLIAGPLIGGFALEILFAKKKLGPATKATVGTAVGAALGLIAKLVIGLLMAGIFLADEFWW